MLSCSFPNAGGDTVSGGTGWRGSATVEAPCRGAKAPGLGVQRELHGEYTELESPSTLIGIKTLGKLGDGQSAMNR
jgi:hypothetical protein